MVKEKDYFSFGSKNENQYLDFPGRQEDILDNEQRASRPDLPLPTQEISHPSDSSDETSKGVGNHNDKDRSIKLIQHSREASRLVDQSMSNRENKNSFLESSIADTRNIPRDSELRSSVTKRKKRENHDIAPNAFIGVEPLSEDAP